MPPTTTWSSPWTPTTRMTRVHRGHAEPDRGGNDVVIASRFQPGSKVVGVPPHRQLFSYGVLVLLRLLYPIPGSRLRLRLPPCGALRFGAPVANFGERLFDLREWGFICTVNSCASCTWSGAVRRGALRAPLRPQGECQPHARHADHQRVRFARCGRAARPRAARRRRPAQG